MFCIAAEAKAKANENEESTMSGKWEGDQKGKGIKLPAMWQSGKLKCNLKAKANPETKAISAVRVVVVAVAYLFHSISISRSFHAYDFNFG